MDDLDFDFDEKNKNIDKKINKIKIKIFFGKIINSPIVVLKFLKKNIVGLFKFWGTLGLLLFLYFTGSYSIIYYKISIDIERYKINSYKEEILKQKNNLNNSIRILECYKNQINRIGNYEKIKILFCKKKY